MSDWPRCGSCGAPHWIDTSIPSALWNQIAPQGGLLCMLCIDARLEAAGLKAEAEFYYDGPALTSRLYGKGSHYEDRLESETESLRSEVARLRELLREMADVNRALASPRPGQGP